MIFSMGGDHTTFMTAVFTQNYLHEIPTDLQTEIMNYSKSKWNIDIDDLDTNEWHCFSSDMIRRDIEKNDEVQHNTIIELHKKLSRSYTTYQFANQKLSEAINDALKYNDQYDFDLYELLNKIKIKESDFMFPIQRIYDWNKNEYITNPDYKPDKDWEYSSDEDE